MKTHTSMKNIPARKVWRAGYCDLSYILDRYGAQFYNAGVYGWNCDIYVDFSTDAAITTGYRNMRGERIPADLLERYDKEGRELSEKMWELENYRERKEDLARRFWNELAALARGDDPAAA